MLFVEFFGLPGSGKSTLAIEVYNKIAHIIPNAVYFQDILDSYSGSFVRKIKRIIVLIKNLKISDLITLYKINKCGKKKLSVAQIREIKTAEEILSLYRMIGKKNNLCIVDQGIIQAIVSILFYANSCDVDNLCDCTIKLFHEYENILFVNVQTNSTIAYERIISREHTHTSRMERINTKKEAILELDKQRYIIQSLYSRLAEIYKNVSVNGEESIDINSTYIIDAIKNYKK